MSKHPQYAFALKAVISAHMLTSAQITVKTAMHGRVPAVLLSSVTYWEMGSYGASDSHPAGMHTMHNHVDTADMLTCA